MSSIKNHYVEFPIAVTINASVAKISFGVGGSVEDPEEIYNLSMPLTSFIGLANHLKGNISDPKFEESIKNGFGDILEEIKISKQ